MRASEAPSPWLLWAKGEEVMVDKHWCTIHNTDFFKTAKMRTYAHPIKEGGETVAWCEEKDLEEVTKLEPVKPEPVPRQPGEDLPPPAPQAVGMMTKEIGDMIRTKMLAVIYGAKIANELTKWYRGQTLGITRIAYDGKDLPSFK